MHIREAVLDDTRAITALHTARIAVWQRLDAAGHVETVAYEALSIYERWLHGGPWMSLETGAIFMNHLLLGGGLPLVAERNGAVIGYAEAYAGVEPEPFGAHLYLNEVTADESEAAAALIGALAERAKRSKRAVLVTKNDDLLAHVQARVRPLACLRRFSLAARQGQVFYRAVESPDADPKRIAGWSMPIGRYTSARAQWEKLWAHVWDTLPDARTRRRHRLHMTAAGQEALICAQQDMYDPRTAEIFMWTPKALTPQIIMAVRDWGHREGYRTLNFAVEEANAGVLGGEAEGDGFRLETCVLSIV